MYAITVSVNDNHCAIFQVVNTIILHKSDNEYDLFKPSEDKLSYYTFATQQDAQTWLYQWYGIRCINLQRLALPIPLPALQKFNIIAIPDDNINNLSNSYTVITIPPDF